jgi:hypothetical protein
LTRDDSRDRGRALGRGRRNRRRWQSADDRGAHEESAQPDRQQALETAGTREAIPKAPNGAQRIGLGMRLSNTLCADHDRIEPGTKAAGEVVGMSQGGDSGCGSSMEATRAAERATPYHSSLETRKRAG